MTFSYTEWVSGDRSNQAKWNTTQTSTAVYHQAYRTTSAPMQEIDDIAEDGTVYYTMASVRKINHFEPPPSEQDGLFLRNPA
jgi:hypothetical protein